jgi:hypothetical protein
MAFERAAYLKTGSNVDAPLLFTHYTAYNMKKEKITKLQKMTGLLPVLFLMLSSLQLKAQASITVRSTNGYNVNITLDAASVIAPTSCPYGYNYNTTIDYNIGFSGTGIPSALYTLQTNLYCGSTANFASLPVSGGVGRVTTGSNPYRSNTDCALASPAYLNCYTFYVTINGPGIPNQTIIASSRPLPVNLLDFSTKDEGANVSLKWSTASEKNNAYFEVERSGDGEQWASVVKLEGQTNSHTVQNYSARDFSPLKGLSFYRLRQVNLDGTSHISALSAVKRKAAVVTHISPNPAINMFTIEGENIGQAEVVIMDAVGKMMTLPMEKMQDIISCNTSSLENGMYFVRITADGTSENHRLLISRT